MIIFPFHLNIIVVGNFLLLHGNNFIFGLHIWHILSDTSELHIYLPYKHFHRIIMIMSFFLLPNILNIFTNLKIKIQISSTNAKLAFSLISTSEAFVFTTVSHLHLSNVHSSKTYHSINLDKSLEWEMICLIWNTGKFCLHLFFYGRYHNGPCIIYVSLSLGRETIMEGFQREVLVRLNFDWWLEFNTQRKLLKTHWTEKEQYF